MEAHFKALCMALLMVFFIINFGGLQFEINAEVLGLPAAVRIRIRGEDY